MKATIYIKDEVNVQVTGLHKDHMDRMYDRYGVLTPGYFFNPKYKLGQWDGKKRFFHRNGTSFLYFIEDIVRRIDNYGYQIDVVDSRPQQPPSPPLIDANIFSHVLHPLTGNPIILRDYQVISVNKLISEGNGILLSCTGSGKTLMTAATCYAYEQVGAKTITIVPSEDLINQTKAMYIVCGLDTGEFSGANKDLDHKHVVSTWQTLQNHTQVLKQFGALIVDECHGAQGPVLNEMLTTTARFIAYRFGVTGSLPKEEMNQMMIHAALGPIRHEVTAAELIRLGVLAQPNIQTLVLEENFEAEYKQFCSEIKIGEAPTYKQFKDKYFPDYTTEKSYLQRNIDRIDWIVDFLLAQRDASDKSNTLCLVDSIPFGRKLAAQIPGAIFVNGKDIKKSSERKKIYKLFETHDDLIVIATVHIASTGIDIPRIFNLTLIDIGKSFTRVIQSIGRGLRRADDKTCVNISDICSDLKFSRKHLNDRIKYYKEAQYPYKQHKIKYTE